MERTNSKVIIIGAGLTGLTLAYLLKKNNIKSVIVEARNRLGGRIFTKRVEGQAPVEMGATWLGKKHSGVTKLLEELGIGIFEQALGHRAIYEPISTSPPQLVTLPLNDEPSYRIQGGTDQLINELSNQLDSTNIYLNQSVESISSQADGLEVICNSHIFNAKFVVSTLPPYLLCEKINITPKLPQDLLNVAKSTHTWMGDSIKVSLTYKQPFWKSEKSSGTIFSNVGPIPEMYDHSNFEDNLFALKGFFNGVYFSLSKTERLEMTLQQLEKYYGPIAREYLNYEEAVWRNEPETFTSYNQHILPHQNNGHPIFRKPYLNGHFFIAGSETSTNHPGYMNGAIHSANFILQQLINQDV